MLLLDWVDLVLWVPPEDLEHVAILDPPDTRCTAAVQLEQVGDIIQVDLLKPSPCLRRELVDLHGPAVIVAIAPDLTPALPLVRDQLLVDLPHGVRSEFGPPERPLPIDNAEPPDWAVVIDEVRGIGA